MKAYLPLAALILVSGCASIISGTTQEVAVNSSPDGATCDITRQGVRLQQVVTPASAMVQRTNRDLLVSCTKPGYQAATATDPSGVEPWVFGNLLAGGVIGLVVDLSTGAVNKYASPASIVLQPAPPPVAQQGSMKPVS